MVISVASGKGGTGKTTIAVNLALSLKNVQFLDCDVEEPNAHIFLKPQITGEQRAVILVPEVDEEKCAYCGKCQEVCVYHAIAVLPGNNGKRGSVLIFPHLCHGCGACSLFCPQGAIKEADKDIGVIEIGGKDDMQFIHGRLNIGEAMSPPLIRQVKKYINPTKTVIVDAPPGTSCPVITAVKGSDFCILVTEPTPFGLNDLTLAVEVLRKLQIPFGVIINRSDIGDGKVEDYCGKEGISVLMRIPFSKEIARAYSCGETLVYRFPDLIKEFRNMFERITTYADRKSQE
ncbi:MAG: ATP-binding protein [Candidatus Omnitrophota bacterium]|jgi:MinD superfamily P-loop ATPase